MEISNPKVWDLSKLLYNSFQQDKQQQKIDTEQLALFKQHNVKPLYPHKIDSQGDIQKYKCCQICQVLNPGSFFCCKTVVPDQSFRKLGLGMCLYFKFLKHATGVLLAISVLSLLSCMLCFLVSVENQFNPFSGYSTFLFSSTLGTFSSQHFKCQYTVITSNQASFNFNCPYGNIQLYGAVFSEQSQNNLNNCQSQIDKYQKGSSNFSTSPYATSSNATSCNGQTSCSIDLTFLASRPNFTTVSYGYQCQNDVYQLGTVDMKSQNLLYAVVSFDLISCIIMILFYWSETKAEQQQVKYFKSSQINLSDFSLKIKGFGLNTFEQEFDIMIRSLTNELGNQFLNELVQVKVPDDQEYLDYQKEKDEAYQQLYQLIDDQFFERGKNPNKFKNAQEFQAFNFNFLSYKRYKQRLSNLINNYTLLQYHPNPQKSDKSLSIFLVVNSVKMKQQIYEHQQNGCFSKYFQFGNKQYRLSQAPAPDTIKWENKGKRTSLRVIVSWFISLCICFLSYLLFGFIQYQQNILLNSYKFDIDCNILYNSTSLISFDETLNQQSSNYKTCFCSANLFNFNNPSYSVCSNWRVQYAFYLAIPVVISLLLVVYNVLVSSIFRWLTVYECHQLVTNQLYSYTIKRSFLLVMNLGLVMILINEQFSSNPINAGGLSFLFQGTYVDFTAAWYINIGSIIILTLLFNIMFPVIQLALANTLKCLKRCWDKKLCCRKTSCKTKSEYIRLFSNDVYPIEQRYAFLISVIIITMAFSCIIPILNIICCLSLFLLYLTDKVLVFKVYQTPINYNDELHSLITKTIYFGLVTHLTLSAYFLSDSTLLAPNSSFANSEFLQSSNPALNTIITTYYIVPYVILLIALLGRAVFRHTLLAFCDKCSNLCKKTLSNINQYKLQQNFYESLSTYQINRLKLLTEAEMSKIASKNIRFDNIFSPIQLNPLNQTLRPLQQANKMGEHEALLRRTLKRIQFEESQRGRRTGPKQTYLIGMPGYEHIANEQFFQQSKKNVLLSEALRICLKDQIQTIGNQQL